MKDTRGLRQPVVAAAITGSVLMLVLGLGYRAAAAWLNAPVNADPVTQETLDRLPFQIDSWAGQSVPMDPNLIAATDTDACLSRQYAQTDAGRAISLWVASGVQVRDLMPHRPEVCYVGNGYTLAAQRIETLSLDSDRALPCNIMHFSRGADRVVVLYYYIVDGQYCQGVSQFRYSVFDRIGYVTQVQIVAAAGTSSGVTSAEEAVLGFAKDSAASLVGLFPSCEHDRGPEQD
jgi:EpsI family protein